MATKQGARPLVQEVVGRLTADKKPDPERDMLVLAALDGRDALSGYLDGNQARPRPEMEDPIDLWETDLAWLKQEYYEGRKRFPWPRT
jgi:hypothetical protein